MTAMENTAPRPQGSEVDNLRQPVGIVHLWWVLLGCFTLLIVFAPGLRVTFNHEALSFTLESFSALVATMVSFVGLARYVFERRPFDLAICVAFGTVAVTAFWFGLILPFSGFTNTSVADAPLWGWIITRLIVGVLLLLGLRTWERGWQLLAGAGARALFIVLAVAVLDVALWYWAGSLPRLLGPAAWQIFDLPGRVTSSVLAGQTALGMLIESVVAGIYFWLAYRLTAAVRHGEDAWLALAIITAAVAQFQFIFYPAPFHPAVTTSDLLWMIAYLLLLAYLGHQYIVASSGMLRQQERTRALLTLSQTPIISRDPNLVLSAASDATNLIDHEATVSVRLGELGSDSSQAHENGFIVPIELDGVRYGSFSVHPVDGQAINQDTEEYLHIVANQTANLLRAIDLYHELARGAVRDERAQLARELHDGLAQDLAVLRLKLSGDHDGSYEHGLADRALSEARYAITILRGQTAAPADFFDALRRQSEDLSDRFSCPVIIEEEDPILGISGGAQVALLRICREAVANAGKHGNPSRVVLRVRQSSGSVEVEISDDGVGFNPSARTRPQAFGLKGMAERVALLGGELFIRSSPGEGTTIMVRLPNTENGSTP